jgi:hypothetical protein
MTFNFIANSNLIGLWYFITITIPLQLKLSIVDDKLINAFLFVIKYFQKKTNKMINDRKHNLDSYV